MEGVECSDRLPQPYFVSSNTSTCGETQPRLGVEMGCVEPKRVTSNLGLEGGLSLLREGAPFPEMKHKVGTSEAAARDR